MYSFLQGQLPLHAVESLVGRDSSLLRVSCPVELSPAPMTNASGENSVDFSQGELLAHNEELTESCSTGELPTPLTFRYAGLLLGVCIYVDEWFLINGR